MSEDSKQQAVMKAKQDLHTIISKLSEVIGEEGALDVGVEVSEQWSGRLAEIEDEEFDE